MKNAPIKKENLSENVIRNSTYDFASNIVAKFGGMILTIFILARLLGPELFGIYALAFSIISIFLTFTDLGVGSAASRYISEAIGKNDITKARTYFSYFLKIKSILSLLAIVILLAVAYPLSFVVYDKPLLFYTLIFSCFYIFISSLASLPQTFLYAFKDLRKIPKIQVVDQATKITFSLLAIYLFTYNFEVPGVFLALSISSLFVFIYTFFIILKKDRNLFFGKKIKIEKPKILKYTGFMGLASISLMIFGSVDILMLAKFVDSSYLGYYKIALTLALSTGAIISGRAILLPIFTQIDRKRLQRAFEKSLRYLLILSIPSTAGLILVSKTFLNLFYPADTNFVLATIPLYALSFLIIIASFISIYKPLFQAEEKPKLLAISSLISLIVNIVLNYFFIKFFLDFGQVYALLGAAMATLISRTFLLSCLIYSAQKEFDIFFFKRKDIFLKPLFASIIMILLALSLEYLIKIQWLLLTSQILLGAIIYLIILYLINGITKEDFMLAKFVPVPKFKNPKIYS